MTALDILTLVLVIALAIYLFVALLNPDRFQ